MSLPRTFDRVPVPEELVTRYARLGVTDSQTVGEAHARNGREWPWLPAVVDESTVLTYSELDQRASALGAHLSAAGVGAGDVVTWQLPNWWEAVVVTHAVWRIGAISNPVAANLRERELRHVLEELRPDAIVTCESFRGFAHAEAFDDINADLGHGPAVKLVARGRRAGWDTCDEVCARSLSHPVAATEPDDPCLILYTSGTTGSAKGVVHTSRSLLAACRRTVRSWGWSWQDRCYMPAPLTHATGMLVGVATPMTAGAGVVLSDRWDAARAVADFSAHDITMSAGATVFLEELVEAWSRAARAPAGLQAYACGGAPVPRVVMNRAEEMGIPSFRLYGMTECPGVTSMTAGHPRGRRHETDGAVAPGCEVRVVDGDGAALPHGSEGELHVRGPQRCIGYVDPGANASAFTPDGWFRSGDLGRVDGEGYVTITGRIKDVINRGGEKLSAAEIEAVLVTHPAVRDAAVVASPDRRFGEVPAAVVVLREAADPQALAAHIRHSGLARSKVPRVWRFVDELPRTASGKLKKFELEPLVTTAPDSGDSRPAQAP